MDNRRILVIDDDLEIWQAYQAILSPAHEVEAEELAGSKLRKLLLSQDSPKTDLAFQVDYAQQGLEGYEIVRDSLAKNNPYAVAFIDIRMPPGWDGMETAVQIRQIDPDIEIVIVTAYSDRSRAEIVQAVQNPEKLLFQRKPFDPEEIEQLALSLTRKWNLSKLQEEHLHKLETTLIEKNEEIKMRQHAEEMLKETNRLNRLILDSLLYPAMLISKDRKILTANRMALALGATPNGFCWQSFGHCDYIPEDDREYFTHQGKAPPQGTKCSFCLADEMFMMNTVMNAPEVKAFGKQWDTWWIPIDGNTFLHYAIDITERLQAQKDLQLSEERYRELVEGTNDLITRVSPNGSFSFVNKMSEKYLGISPEECVGSIAFQFIHPDDQAMTKEWFHKCIDQKVAVATIENRQMNIKTNEIFWMHWTSTFNYDKQGNLVHIGGIARNKTNQKQAEEALQKAHDKLEQRVKERTQELEKTHQQLLHAEKLSAIGGLSASIAHEFNNPLQGVMNVVKGVKRRTQLDKEDAKLIDMAVNECIRMKDLIKSLQDFNRPSSGRMAPMNIHATIDSLLLLSKNEYKTKGITVETNYDNNMPLVTAVADQIKQVLLNLLTNATYACTNGGIISVSTEVVNEELIAIKIHDTGRGIKQEHIDKIFDPFFTTKTTTKGTGLGLSVSYGIIKKHGGTIDVKSEQGQGTSFYIVLPI